MTKKPLPKSVKSIKARIQREYAQKRAELGVGAPNLKKGPVFYLAVIVILLIVGGLVLSAAKDGTLTLSKKRIERRDLMARKSMDALSVALGRYKFHTGEYPSEAEGLEVLALKEYPGKAGWDGPYVNHIVKDPWGNPYIYSPREGGGNPVLYSKGPDGRAGTLDDVLPDQLSFEEPFRDTSWTNGWAPYRLRGIVVAPDKLTKQRVQEEMKAYDR